MYNDQGTLTTIVALLFMFGCLPAALASGMRFPWDPASSFLYLVVAGMITAAFIYLQPDLALVSLTAALALWIMGALMRRPMPTKSQAKKGRSE